jgi:hypothetical protein
MNGKKSSEKNPKRIEKQRKSNLNGLIIKVSAGILIKVKNFLHGISSEKVHQ